MDNNERLNSLITELKRGSLTLSVLGALKNQHYGYSLLQFLQDKDINIEANTLYPMLRRLEEQGLLFSAWDTSSNRPRKYYTLSDEGHSVYLELLKEWRKMQSSIHSICEGDFL
ncbi:MAG: PadR family transcriptional regulator [Clostridiales bacterium]|nr:PadR family transcriptional regulator [Clostridiales bacterium]